MKAGKGAALAAGILAASGMALSSWAMPLQAQETTFTADRASEYSEVTGWPDFTGVWNPDWSLLFGSGGGRPAVQPALTPTAQAALDAFRELQAREGVDQFNQVHCIPPGMPGIMRQPYPIEFLFSPGRVTIMAETYSQNRRIYVDGRALPEDPDPLFNGTSVGHWDGDTLIVETVGFNDLVSYAPGIKHGERMHISERFWLEANDVLRVETTITDPDTLTEPFVQQLAFRRQPTWSIREYECNENNRLVDGEDGANIDLGLEEEGDPFGPPPGE